MSKCIVIDTSVARACGRGNLQANSPAPQCIRALDAVREGGFRTAMCLDLKDEWMRHAGEFAKRWLGNMIARKRFVTCSGVWGGASSLEAAAARLPESQEREALKDAHVVGLAMQTDRRVLSLDDAQRKILCVIANDMKDILTLHWANPRLDYVHGWIIGGAADDVSLCISNAGLR